MFSLIFELEKLTKFGSKKDRKIRLKKPFIERVKREMREEQTTLRNFAMNLDKVGPKLQELIDYEIGQ